MCNYKFYWFMWKDPPSLRVKFNCINFKENNVNVYRFFIRTTCSCVLWYFKNTKSKHRGGFFLPVNIGSKNKISFKGMGHCLHACNFLKKWTEDIWLNRYIFTNLEIYTLQDKLIRHFTRQGPDQERESAIYTFV